MNQQNLFNALHDLDVIANYDEMRQIENAVFKDNPKIQQADNIIRRFVEWDSDYKESDDVTYERYNQLIRDCIKYVNNYPTSSGEVDGKP